MSGLTYASAYAFAKSTINSDEDNTDDEQVTLAAAAAAASYGTRGTRRRSRRVDAEITKDTIVALQNEAGKLRTSISLLCNCVLLVSITIARICVQVFRSNVHRKL
jgi:hypothetical protein